MPAWAIKRSSSDKYSLFLGGASSKDAALDAASIFRVASSMALLAASMAMASLSDTLIGVGVGGRLSSS